MGGMDWGHVQEGRDASGQGRACATNSGQQEAVWCGRGALAQVGACSGGPWGLHDVGQVWYVIRGSRGIWFGCGTGMHAGVMGHALGARKAWH